MNHIFALISAPCVWYLWSCWWRGLYWLCLFFDAVSVFLLW